MHPWNYLDYILLAIIALSFLWGLIRGIFSETFAILTWVVAFIVSVAFSSIVQKHIAQYPIHKAMIEPLTYLVIFVTVLVVGGLINYILSTLFVHKKSWPNRLIGCLIGFVRGFLIVLIIVFAVSYTPIHARPYFENSVFVKWMAHPVAFLRGEVKKFKRNGVL